VPSAVRLSAASMNENGPNVETISRIEPAAATRCSGPSRRQAATRPRACSESLPAREPCIDLVPVADLRLALLPAEVDLVIFAQLREVDAAPLGVADDDLHRLERGGRRLQLVDRLGHHAAGPAAAVTRRR